MKNKLIFSFLLAVFFLTPAICRSQDIFSVSPAVIQVDHLKSGMEYSTDIIVKRSNVTDTNIISFQVPLSPISNWLKFETNFYFLDDGQTSISVPVKISMPKDVKAGKYQGTIMVAMQKTVDEKVGMRLGSNLGQLISVNIEVVTKDYVELKINTVEVSSANMSCVDKDGVGMGELILKINGTNKGNIPSGPRKVTVSLFDIKTKKVIYDFSNEQIKKIDPFLSETISVPLIGKLTAGSYLAQVKIFDQGQNKPMKEYSAKVDVRPSNVPLCLVKDESEYKSIFAIIAGLIVLLVAIFNKFYKNLRLS